MWAWRVASVLVLAQYGEAGKRDIGTTHKVIGARNNSENNCPVCKTVQDGDMSGLYTLEGVEDPRCQDGCLYGKDNRQYCFEKGGYTINYTCPEDPKDPPNVLVKKSLAEYEQALCMDGSVATYYLEEREDFTENLLIFLPGGFFCTSAETCAKRCQDQPYYCTATTFETLQFDSVFMSTDPEVNPPFHNHTKVYVPYCSSDLYAGTGKDTENGYIFHGHYILEGILKDLREQLNASKQVVLYGQSAGGFGVTLNCDFAAELIHQENPGADVRCIIDGSDFYPYQETQTAGCPQYVRQGILLSSSYWQASPDMSCFQDNISDPSRCVMLPDYYKYIVTPLMTINAYIDTEQAVHPCTPVYPENSAFWEVYRQAMKSLAEDFVAEKPDNGIFLLRCPAHIVSDTYWDTVSIDVNGTQIALKKAIYNFLNPGSGPFQVMDAPDAVHDQDICPNLA